MKQLIIEIWNSPDIAVQELLKLTGGFAIFGATALTVFAMCWNV